MNNTNVKLPKKEEKKYSPTIVRTCTCKHEYQDKRYGKNMRLMNVTGKKNKAHIARCTVCGKEYIL